MLKQEGDGLHAQSKLQFCPLELKHEMMKRQLTNQGRDQENAWNKEVRTYSRKGLEKFF